MTNQQILSYVDHTLLSPTATWTDIEKICKESIKYQTASVCIPPSFVEQVRIAFPSLNICTVVGFPLGYSTTDTKIAETQNAIIRGATEIDTVINISHAKMSLAYEITTELTQLKKICGHRILKVIIETCYLTEDEKIAMCKAVSKSGADYIKTSTGFGTPPAAHPVGATFDDIILFKENIASHVKIKAAGGISTKEDMIKFIELGAERLGTSKAVGLLSSGIEQKGY